MNTRVLERRYPQEPLEIEIKCPLGFESHDYLLALGAPCQAPAYMYQIVLVNPSSVAGIPPFR